MFFSFAMLFACDVPVDTSWSVTVTGLETNCVSDSSGYLKTYQYDLEYDGTSTEIYIDDALFARGETLGCSLDYTSFAYLEDSNDGKFTWEISGDADVQGAAGGCVDDGLDWKGTEVLSVLESENPAVEAGCTYTMSVEGTFIQ